MNVLQPKFQIKYNKRDITADLTPHLLSVTYTDKVAGESDEIEIRLEDTDALWRNEWYPTKGDTLQLWFGYENNTVYAGAFQIDEIEVSGPPDTVTMRGLAAGIKNAIRTKTSKAHEGKSLKEIAQDVAKKHGLTVDDGSRTITTKVSYIPEYADMVSRAQGIEEQAGKLGRDALIAQYINGLSNTAASLRKKGQPKTAEAIEGLVRTGQATATLGLDQARAAKIFKSIAGHLRNYAAKLPKGDTPQTTYQSGVLQGLRTERTTQNRETDLAFLTRVCSEFGIVFSIRDTKLTFMSIFDLEGAAPSVTLDRKNIMRYSIKDKALGVFKKAVVKYHNPKTGENAEGEFDAEPLEGDGNSYEPVTSGDTLEIRTRAENKQQAELKAKAALHQTNSKESEGSLQLPGNPLLVAGNNFLLTGLGVLSGVYHITESSHRIDRGSGYVTDINFKRIGVTAKNNAK